MVGTRYLFDECKVFFFVFLLFWSTENGSLAEKPNQNEPVPKKIKIKRYMYKAHAVNYKLFSPSFTILASNTKSCIFSKRQSKRFLSVFTETSTAPSEMETEATCTCFPSCPASVLSYPRPGCCIAVGETFDIGSCHLLL